jgi:polar amino acid transport system substrate-binding protein
MKPHSPGACRAWLGAALLAVSGAASAGCSRPILVPAAPVGVAVTVTGQKIGGMYPELLRLVGSKAGCEFKFSVVPRIRLEVMFENGTADLLLAAIHTSRRDQAGLFVPMVETRATLLSLNSDRPAVRSIAQLLERRELRVALVRGFDYGDAYLDLIDKLTVQGRIYMEANPIAVARLIKGGMADVTIMPATSFIGGLQGDRRTEGLAAKLHIEALDELPWIRSGIYLSRTSLTPADRALLEQALVASVRSGVWWQALRRYYTPAVMHLNMRPLSADR